MSLEALRKIVEDYRLIAERLAKQAWNLDGDDIEDDAARIYILTTELQAEIERMDNEQRELADAAMLVEREKE